VATAAAGAADGAFIRRCQGMLPGTSVGIAR
jgi:hypothetical protein